MTMTLTPEEVKQYAHILLDEMLDKRPHSEVLAALDKRFTAEQLELHKLTAIGCVRVRRDIDERMRKLRDGATAAA
jgi:hypothetical protein